MFTRDLGVGDVSLRHQVDWQVGAHLFAAGFDAHALRTTWGWTITGDRNSSVANGSAVIGGAGLPSLLASERRSTRSAPGCATGSRSGSACASSPAYASTGVG